jgi:glycosyltransferase involved in cell wall biosynthesis
LKPIKVVICTDGIYPHSIGGMQKHSRKLIEHLAITKETELVVIHPHNEHIFPKELKVNEIRIHGIDKGRNYIAECYRYSKRVFEVLENYPHHLIYSQGLSVWFNCRKLRKRLIINPHGLESYQAISLKARLTGVLFIRIFNHLFKNASKVISLGGRLTGFLVKNMNNASSKIEIIPNGVDLPVKVKRKERSQKLNVLLISRFESNKGIELFLKAAESILKDPQYSDKFNFILAGSGSLLKPLREKYESENIKFYGFVMDEDIPGLYEKNDLFVLPTLFEGMPTVVLEAMSYGLPVIVTDVGATSALVDRSNGYLIKRNNERELRDAMIGFFNLASEKKEELSKASLKKVREKFTWEIVTQKHLDLFKTFSNV